MLPSTPEFFCFLLLIFVLYWLTSRIRAAAILLICSANLFFFAKWGLIYLALIPAASTCDFFIGRLLARTESKLNRRLLISTSLLINIGLIVSSKYLPLFTGHGWILPLSLSFYAFQALTYTIDIYRRDIEPSASYSTYLASVNFFPTILAGPITRVADLIPQFTKGRPLSAEDGGRAFFLIGMGLMKKFLIADYLAVNLINRVFDLPTLYSGGDVLVAVYGYAFQLYYDFSGYTDIAIGSALLLGIKLPPNFNAPYRAVNIADFWRRWHITLSNWLRDYLYFSLPGKRSKWRPYLNLVITFAIGGLWHGANWTYLIWGMLHGSGLAVFRGWQTARGKRKANTAWWAKLAGIVLTFHFVLLAWIFFRAANVETALAILKQLGAFPYGFDNVTRPFL
jgi:alginate O-acetyltransferase complex protein AlgI